MVRTPGRAYRPPPPAPSRPSRCACKHLPVAVTRPAWVLLPITSVLASIEKFNGVSMQLRDVAGLAALVLPRSTPHSLTMNKRRRPSAPPVPTAGLVQSQAGPERTNARSK